jgi:tetratricopeptide (TPR) repeat protein
MRSLLSVLVLGCSVGLWAQNSTPSASEPANAQTPDSSSSPASKPAAPRTPNLAPPRSDSVNADALDNEPGESSSKDTLIDLSPPADDAKAHPQSSEMLMDVERSSGDANVSEFHPWNPHKAAKDVEVGDFYFKRKNYRAAEDRYREALFYKDNDAVATFRLAVCLDKMDQPDEARTQYEAYLKILPHGPQADEAQKAIERLKGPAAAAKPAK